MHIEPCSLQFVSDHFKTQEMCEKAVGAVPWQVHYLPDHLKTQEMCNEIMRIDPAAFFIFNRFKTQEMCEKAV